MKKSLILLASLGIGTTAIAQDMPAGAPMQGSPPMTNSPASPSMPTDSTMPPQTMAPPPSDNGMAPPSSGGGMASPMPGSGTASPGMAASATDTSNYPRCSRTMTDKCVQGGAPRRPHK